MTTQIKKPVKKTKSIPRNTEPVVESKPEQVIESKSEQVIDSKSDDKPIVSDSKPIEKHDQLTEFIEKLNDMKKALSIVIDDVKKFQKTFKKPRNVNVKSGFSKQVPISSDLAKFMNVPETDNVSRVDVTKFVTQYIKTCDLQVPTNKQHFKIDNKLSKLLRLDKDSELHYFKLQSHLKHHYPKVETV